MPLSDTDMHNALSRVLKALNLSHSAVRFVNENVFTSVRRMRVLMEFEQIPPPRNHPTVARLELRGQWHYPVMMMNDYAMRDPDPPKIMLFDSSGGLVKTFHPETVDEVCEILEKQVFEAHSLEERAKEAKTAEARAKFLALKAEETQIQIQAAIQAALDKHCAQLKQLSESLANDLRAASITSHVDVDQSSTSDVFKACGAPYAALAVSKAVEKAVYLGLLQGVRG